MLDKPDPSDWLMGRRTLDGWGYSPLDQINLGSPVNGFLVTYTANGKQYVVVSTGASLVSTGVSRLAPELKQGSANKLYVSSIL